MESLRRRDLIKGMSFLGVAAGVKPAAASYDPAAKFGLKISEVEYRRNTAGRQLIARIYEPVGKGPFPTVLDLHGGAWNAKDRKAEEPMDRLEFRMYGPSATASDPDKRIWISGPPGPVNIWTGMCTTPFAATLRDKTNYVDLTGLAKVGWTTRASGFHAVRPVIKLMDGTFLVGDHAEASTTTFLESEFAFAGLRWMKLDIDRIVTIGRYGSVGEASNWADAPDLSKVDEVRFVYLMPGSGHGSGGYVNVASFELYGTPVKRGGGH